MRRLPLVCLSFILLTTAIHAQEIDKRLAPAKTLNAYFPLAVPSSKEEWAKRRQEVREQVLVSQGLWPMPEQTPLKATIHGKVERDGYTVEKVFFASYPGHYVCGNLYRPTSAAPAKKLPGVLCPHGHWANGRFHEAKDWENQMKIGAEQTEASAKYPLQARCAQLARLGCVVFHYDMVGNADSQQIAHRAGFTDPEAELRLQNFMGLQTYNSIRALDFLLSLPEVDPSRIGVTGASGGGTQTFMLCAIDDRPAAAFPAVMVSTAMQGGCICENSSYLRVGTGNIELAGLFAPKPLGMSGADDWTIDIETKGLPELKALYKLLGAPDNVMAKALKQFKHNYNQPSREMMYDFFNEHLKLGHKSPIKEQPFSPIPPKELSVFDAEHALPKDAVNADGLRRYMTMDSDKQLERLLPKDAKTLAEYRRVLGAALRVMMGSHLPDPAEVAVVGAVAVSEPAPTKPNAPHQRIARVSRKGENETVPMTLVLPPGWDGTIVVSVHPGGTDSVMNEPTSRAILDKKAAILAVDTLWTGKQRLVVAHLHPALLKAAKVTSKEAIESLIAPGAKVTAQAGNHVLIASLNPGITINHLQKQVISTKDGAKVNLTDVATFSVEKPPVNEGFAGFTFGYNRPLVSERVHDILTAVAYARTLKAKTIHIVGHGKAGPWVALARGLCGDAVARTAADLDGFRFERIGSNQDEMMLPGALKYGGLLALAGLCAPHEMYLHNAEGSGNPRFLEGAYRSANAGKSLRIEGEAAKGDAVATWLLR